MRWEFPVRFREEESRFILAEKLFCELSVYHRKKYLQHFDRMSNLVCALLMFYCIFMSLSEVSSADFAYVYGTRKHKEHVMENLRNLRQPVVKFRGISG